MTKIKSTKHALLMSTLALLMCVSMFVGSTFAWFTDSVTSAGNTIQSGTLKVDLVDADGNSMEGQVIEFVAKDGRAQNEILWEPGCTYETEPVFVVNKGNLALKYEIVINGITGDAKLLEAIEWTVTVADVKTELADLSGELLANETSDAIVLSGHMKETAGNEYQGLTVEGISISVFATQLTHESDSFGDQYDALATYMNKNADGEWEIDSVGQLIYFAKQVNSGNSYKDETIILTKEINLAGINWTPIGNWDNTFDGTFDGQGYTISNLYINAPAGEGVGLFGVTQNATIKGVNIENVDVTGYSMVSALVGAPYPSTISDCHVTGKVNLVAEWAYVGGIAGYCYYGTQVDNCSVVADEMGSIVSKTRNAVGGITAWLLEGNHKVMNCQVKNLNLTGWTNIGGITGFVHYNNTIEGCSVENVKLTKTRADGNPGIGLIAGGWSYSASNAITLRNNTVKNATMEGNHIAYAAYNELYGSEFGGATTTNFVLDGNTTEQITNNLVEVKKVGSTDELVNALKNGDNVVLSKDISGVDANTAITIAAGKDVILDLNGYEIAATANKTGNQELFLVKGTMTVKNGTLELVAQNNQEWNAMATIFDVTAGGVLKVDGVTANVAGTDMNFFAHLNNWGSATLEMTNCNITTTYVAVRAFNSGYDMNTVTIKDCDFYNGRMFWVHNYTSEGKDDSTLTLDIYGNNNTSDNAKPVRFGFSNSVYYDINGNLIP